METFDLILFAGQSNMAGRGATSTKWSESAPEILKGAGYEYRAITDSDRFNPIEEPFGVNENDPNGIYEPGMKTGSLVTSFVNMYYRTTEEPVIAVSASKGGSSISEWQGNDDLLSDAIRRLKKAMDYAKKNRIHIRHKYVLWCQGETDGDKGMPPEVYKKKFRAMFSKLRDIGIEKCFLITIGEYNGRCGYEAQYISIRNAQIELSIEMDDVMIACDDFHRMKALGLMKDDFHYYQKAYNEVGTAAGKAVGMFVANIKS